jgi:hypothetical protein
MKKARGERKAYQKSKLLLPNSTEDLEGVNILSDNTGPWRAVPASVHWEGLSDGEEEEDECEFTGI